MDAVVSGLWLTAILMVLLIPVVSRDIENSALWHFLIVPSATLNIIAWLIVSSMFIPEHVVIVGILSVVVAVGAVTFAIMVGKREEPALKGVSE